MPVSFTASFTTLLMVYWVHLVSFCWFPVPLCDASRRLWWPWAAYFKCLMAGVTTALTKTIYKPLVPFYCPLPSLPALTHPPVLQIYLLVIWLLCYIGYLTVIQMSFFVILAAAWHHITSYFRSSKMFLLGKRKVPIIKWIWLRNSQAFVSIIPLEYVFWWVNNSYNFSFELLCVVMGCEYSRAIFLF